ncbi:MAG: hypothetical protein K2X82_21965 [Gemmataceae bacterium]|nr:hypothetical protein [Gemmataceae bacterium]
MRWTSVMAFLAAVGLAGCGSPTASGPGGSGREAPKDKVAAERAKLSADDRALVDAQEWCAVQHDERLGSMGAPVKLEVKGRPVFLCCKGCKKSAEADPDKTLAAVDDLKAKKAAQ